MEIASSNRGTAGIEEAIRDSDILEQLGIRLDDDAGGPDRVTIECYPLDEFQFSNAHTTVQNNQQQVSSAIVPAKQDPHGSSKPNMDMDFDWLFAATSSSSNLGGAPSKTNTDPVNLNNNVLDNQVEKISAPERPGMCSSYVSAPSESDMPKIIQKLKAELKSRDSTIFSMKKLLLEEKELRLVRRKQIENHRELMQYKKSYEELLPAYKTLEAEVFRLRNEVDSNRLLIEQQVAFINSLKADNSDLTKKLETGTAPEKKKLLNETKDLKRRIRKYEEEIDSKNATITKLRTKASSNSAMSDIFSGTARSGSSPSMAHIMENVRHLISKEFKKLNGNVGNPVLSSLSGNSYVHRESDTDDTESFHLPSRLSTISSLDGDSFDGNYTESNVPSVASLSPPSSVDNRDYVEPNLNPSSLLPVSQISVTAPPTAIFTDVVIENTKITNSSASSASSVCSSSSGYSSPQKIKTISRRKRKTSFKTPADVHASGDKKSSLPDSSEELNEAPKTLLPLTAPLPSVPADLFITDTYEVSERSPNDPVQKATVQISPVRRSPRRKVRKAYDSSDWETPETATKAKASIDVPKSGVKSPKVGTKVQENQIRSIFDSDEDETAESGTAVASKVTLDQTETADVSSGSTLTEDPMVVLCLANAGMSTPPRVSDHSENLSSCSELSLSFSPTSDIHSPGRGAKNEFCEKTKATMETSDSQGVNPCTTSHTLNQDKVAPNISLCQATPRKPVDSHREAKKSPSSNKRKGISLSDSDSEDDAPSPLVTAVRSHGARTSFGKSPKRPTSTEVPKERNYDLPAKRIAQKKVTISEMNIIPAMPKVQSQKMSARDKIGNTTDIVAVGSGENMCARKKLEMSMRQRGKPKYLELLKVSGPLRGSAKIGDKDKEIAILASPRENGQKSCLMEPTQLKHISATKEISVPIAPDGGSGLQSTSQPPETVPTSALNAHLSEEMVRNKDNFRKCPIESKEIGPNENETKKSPPFASILTMSGHPEVSRPEAAPAVSLADDLCLSSDDEDSCSEGEFSALSVTDVSLDVPILCSAPVETVTTAQVKPSQDHKVTTNASSLEETLIAPASSVNINVLPKKPPLPISRRICNTQNSSANSIPARTRTAPSVFRTKAATLKDTVVPIDTIQESNICAVENVEEYRTPVKRIRLSRASDEVVPVISDETSTKATTVRTNVKIPVTAKVTEYLVPPVAKSQVRKTTSTLKSTLCKEFQPSVPEQTVVNNKKVDISSQKLSARQRLRDTLAIVAVGSGENVCDKKKLELLARKSVARLRLGKDESASPPSDVATRVCTRRSSTEKSENSEVKLCAVSATQVKEVSGYCTRGRAAVANPELGVAKTNAVVGLLRGRTSKPTTQQKLFAQLRKLSSTRSVSAVKSKRPQEAGQKQKCQGKILAFADNEPIETLDSVETLTMCPTKNTRHRTVTDVGQRGKRTGFGVAPAACSMKTDVDASSALDSFTENSPELEVALHFPNRILPNIVDVLPKNTNISGRQIEQRDDCVGADLLKKLFGIAAKSVTPQEFALQFKNVEAEMKKPPLSFYLSRRFYDDVVDSVMGYAMQKSDENAIIERAKNLCSKIRWLQSVHPLYRELDISIVSYFISEILAKRSYVFPRDDILNGVGIVYGTVFREFGFAKLGANALFVVLLKRTQQKFAFAQGFISAFPDLYANRQALQDTLRRGIFMALVYAPLYTDSIYYNNVRDIFRDGLDVPIPELGYKAVFRNMWESFKGKEMQEDIEGGEKTFSMLLVQCHWNLSVQIMDENFDVIYSEWRSNQISDAVFMVFLKSVVWAAEIAITTTESTLGDIQNKFEKVLSESSDTMTPLLIATLSDGVKKLRKLLFRSPSKPSLPPARYITHNSLRELKANEAKEDKKNRRKYKRRIRGAAAKKSKAGSQIVPEVTR